MFQDLDLALYSNDAGRTWKPLWDVAEDDQGALRVLTSELRYGRVGVAVDDAHVFVFGVRAFPGLAISERLELDYVYASADGGESFEVLTAEFGGFEAVGQGWFGNRRYAIGDAQLVSDGERFAASLDGGQSWKEHRPRTSATEPGADLARFGPNPNGSGGTAPYTTWSEGEVRLNFFGQEHFDSAQNYMPYERLDEATGEGELAWLNFGGLPLDGLVAVLSVREDEVDVVVAIDPQSVSEQLDYRMRCTLGANVPPQRVTMPQPKSLREVEPGEVAIVAPVRMGTDRHINTERNFALTPSLKAYVQNEQSVMVAGSYAGRINRAIPGAFDGVESVGALTWVRENALEVLFQAGDAFGGSYSSDGLRSFNALNAAVLHDGLTGYRNFPTSSQGFDSASTTMGVTIANRDAGSVEIRSPSGGPDAQAWRFGGNTFLSGGFMINAGSHRQSSDELGDIYVHVSDVLGARNADHLRCLEDVSEPGCAVLPDSPGWSLHGLGKRIMDTDREGRLYVIEPMRRQLLVHRPERGVDQWDVVVDGLLEPVDLEIVHHDGRTFALILDHDIIAVDVESSVQVLSVEVGGLEAEVVEAGEFELTFAWPEALEPGEHVAVVEMTHGRVEAAVELLAHDSVTLVDFSPAGGFIQRRAERLPIFDGYLVAPMFTHFQQSDGAPIFDSYGLARMPLEQGAREVTFAEGAREGRSPERARYLFDRLVETTRNPWVSVDDGVLRVMNKGGESDSLQVVELSPGETPGAWQRTVGGAGGEAFYTFFRVAGARWFGESPVVAVGRPFADAPMDLELHGVEVEEDAQAALDALTYRDTSVGWVSDEAVFASTCGEAGAPAGVMRLSLVADEVEGTLRVNSPLEVRDGLDETRAILGCQGREEGFYWVERQGGVDALFVLGNEGGVERVVTLPDDLPGVGDRYDVPRAAPSDPQRWQSGLLNFEVFDDGDVVVLMSPTDAPAQLVVARWDAALESWAVGEAQEVMMRDGLGDRCVGPVEALSCFRDIGLYGCGPMACDVGLRLPGVQEGVRVRGANFRVFDNALHVMLEAEHLARPNHDVWNRNELQYHRLEMP